MKKLMKSVLACALAFAMVLTVMPVNAYAANKKAVVVTNQKQLEKALKNGATNIVIKTNKNVKITIPDSKKAAKATISVQAKNATITNKASVKSIEIKDAKAFVESGKNNDIKITDSKLSLTVSKASKGADIQVAKKDADIKVVAKGDVASVTVAKTANVVLTVNKTAKVDSVNVAAKGASVDLNAKGTVSDVKVSEKAADTKLNINASGKVENVQIDAKADVVVAGSTTEAVKVTVNAKDTTIKAETAIDTTLNADTKVDLSKGAEGSTVTTGENVKADVANNTTDKVTVKDSTGKETTVDAGKTETKTDDGKKDDEKKDDQKTDDNSGTVTPAPTPTPTPDPTPSHEPGVDFGGAEDSVKSEVLFYEKYDANQLRLLITFDAAHVYGENGEEDHNWYADFRDDDQYLTYIGDWTSDDDQYQVCYEIPWDIPAGDHSFTFDYQICKDDSGEVIVQKEYKVSYSVNEELLQKFTNPELDCIEVVDGKLWVNFKIGVPQDSSKVSLSISKIVESDKKELVNIVNYQKAEEQVQRYIVELDKELEEGATYEVTASVYNHEASTIQFTYPATDGGDDGGDDSNGCLNGTDCEHGILYLYCKPEIAGKSYSIKIGDQVFEEINGELDEEDQFYLIQVDVSELEEGSKHTVIVTAEGMEDGRAEFTVTKENSDAEN